MSTTLLIDAIEKLYQLHNSLYEIAVKKTKIIKDGDMDSLNELMKEEHTHIAAIHKLEEVRQQAVRQICPEKEEPSVSDCLALMEDHEQATLQAAAYRLSSLLAELKEQNHLNQQLLYQSLQFVNFSLNLMRPQPASLNYAPPTKKIQNSTSLGLFNSKA
nr:flagellar protein FlgN [uncultured Bacillus sp.]